MIELFESQGKKLFEEVGCSFQGIVDCLESKFGAVFLPRSLVKTLKVQAPGGNIASEGRRNSMGANSSRDIEAEIRRAAPYNSEVLKHSRNSPPKRGASLNASVNVMKDRKASESIPDAVASFLKRDASLEGLSKEP